MPRTTRPPPLAHALALAALSGAGCDFCTCPTVPEATLSALPPALSATGLYSDTPARSLAPGVIAYRPRFALW